MSRRNVKKFSDFSNVHNQKNYLTPEEFPEGSFGSPIDKEEAVYGKSTPWEKGQQRDSAYVFPYREMHEDLPRQTPGAHVIHDESGDVDPQHEEFEE